MTFLFLTASPRGLEVRQFQAEAELFLRCMGIAQNLQVCLMQPLGTGFILPVVAVSLRSGVALQLVEFGRPIRSASALSDPTVIVAIRTFQS